MALGLLHPLQADAKRIKVDVKTPGTLATLVGDKNKNKITAITLKGRLNSADLRYLREMAGRDYEGKPTPGAAARDRHAGHIVRKGEGRLCQICPEVAAAVSVFAGGAVL